MGTPSKSMFTSIVGTLIESLIVDADADNGADAVKGAIPISISSNNAAAGIFALDTIIHFLFLEL
ncbi:hypothetical protein D3C86_1941760 [compost metagenome]